MGFAKSDEEGRRLNVCCILIVHLSKISLHWSDADAILVGQTRLRLGLPPRDAWMASFSPIKLCDDDDAAVYRAGAEGERERCRF